MKVRVAPSVEQRIRDEAFYYMKYVSLDVARRITKELRQAIDKLVDKQSGNRVDDLPSNYRRIRVKPFYFFYRLNSDDGYLVVYLLRHERQRPYTKSYHVRLANKAERETN